MSVADEVAVASALAGRLTAAGLKVFDLDQVPVRLPQHYLELHLTRRFTDELSRVGGNRPWSGWRLALRFLSDGSVDNLRRDRDKAHQALTAGQVNLLGEPTIVGLESTQDIGPADSTGYFDASSVYVFSR